MSPELMSCEQIQKNTKTAPIDYIFFIYSTFPKKFKVRPSARKCRKKGYLIWQNTPAAAG